jgi:carbonic anhydrase
MDARIDPAAAFGIALGDAHVIRNAGGNAQDALRSILISQHLLGTREIVLVKHTGCGMLTFSNEDARAAVRGNGGRVNEAFDFQPFAELEAAVKRDVEFLTGHEGFPEDVATSGWIYDVETGRVGRVV